MQLSDMRGIAPQLNWSKDDGQCIVALGEGCRLAVWDEGGHWTISVDTDGDSFEMDVNVRPEDAPRAFAATMSAWEAFSEAMGPYTGPWEGTASVLQFYTDEQLDDIACEVSQ